MSYKYLALPAQEGLQRLLGTGLATNGVGVGHKPAGLCHFIATHQAPLPQRTHSEAGIGGGSVVVVRHGTQAQTQLES